MHFYLMQRRLGWYSTWTALAPASSCKGHCCADQSLHDTFCRWLQSLSMQPPDLE